MKIGLGGAAAIIRLAVVVFILSFPAIASAGPPYITDDPEPVDYHHWEVYVASLFSKQPGAWSSTAPHLEVNYGLLQNLQVHVIAPMGLYAPSKGAASYGYSDTEVGSKFRFVQEGEWMPQIGTYPMFELPTGSHSRNLGSGYLQMLIPIWLQKSAGKWTVYGGAGNWLDPGPQNHNLYFTGVVIQREVLPDLTPGIEIFHGIEGDVGGPHATGINLGLIWDLSALHHILLSAGPTFDGPNQLQGYFAYILTFGP